MSVEAAVKTARLRSPFAIGHARDQLLVLVGQLGSGMGNLAFALALTRALRPSAFVQMAVFLALYLIIHVPAGSLSAGAAAAPDFVAHVRRRALAAGLIAGAATAAAALPLSVLLHLPVGLVLLLAAAMPGAGVLALSRGRLYGQRRHARVAATLLTEPAVRLALGLPLAASLGALGAATAVVAAGYAALIVAARRGSAQTIAPLDSTVRVPAGVRATVIAFLLLAALQNIDLVLASQLLPKQEAARFAALSTLGGMAAYATATIPLVFLPRASRGPDGALPAALVLAALLGTAATVAFALVPQAALVAILGDGYRIGSTLGVPYLAAMTLLGVARVLVAHRCARQQQRRVAVVLVVATLSQAGAIAVLARTAEHVATATLMVTGLAVIGLVPLPRRPTRRALLREPEPRGSAKVKLLVVALTLVGLAVRLPVSRSIWIDEATSILQARLSFPDLLQSLATTDVHPPLHHALLWLTVRVFGDGEMAVRLPSIVAGAALVPLLYLTAVKLWDRRTGVVAAVLVTVAPLAVWYSQEARMYAVFMVFAVAALWAQASLFRRSSVWAWTVFTAATACMMWTQYFSVLPIAVQQVGFALLLWQRHRRREPIGAHLLGWFLSLAALVACAVPLFSILDVQFAAYAERGVGFGAPSQAGTAAVLTTEKGLTVYSLLANLIWAMLGYHSDRTMAQIVALWPFGVLLMALLLGRGRSKEVTLLVGLVAVPLAALFALGSVRRDLFELRYVIGVVPVMLLLTARTVASWTWSRAGTVVATSVLAAVFSIGLADQQLNGTNPRLYDFRGALTLVAEQAEPGDAILYEPQFLDDIIAYYTPSLQARPLGDGLPPPTARRVYLVGSFRDVPGVAGRTGGAVALLEQRRRLVDRLEVPNVTVWVFE